MVDKVPLLKELCRVIKAQTLSNETTIYTAVLVRRGYMPQLL
jgi:hypothetical protein